MQSLFMPSLFNIDKFKLEELRLNLLEDFISVYLYVRKK
jgi:hypothetical protein